MLYEHKFDITVIKTEVAPASTKLPVHYPRTYVDIAFNGVTMKTDFNKEKHPLKTTHWNRTFSFSCQGARKLDKTFIITLYKIAHVGNITNSQTIEIVGTVNGTPDMFEKDRVIRRVFEGTRSSIEFRITPRGTRNLSMFALLIGIDEYKSKEITNLSGCVADAKDMEELLKYDLHVPASSIRTLHNNEATRENIIHEIKTHLIGNSAINQERNNSIIIFFAGHGGRAPAPQGWPATPDGKIEVICPHDQMESDGKGGFISAIPDRTINSLVRKLADEKGNNITLIFDSCHSGGIGRVGTMPDGYSERSSNHSVKVHPDVDRDIWQAHTTPAGFKHRDMDSSVLLAACTHEEKAHEVRSEQAMRGVFTSLFVKEVRLSVQQSTRISYFDLIKLLHPQITQEVKQTPQCEGNHKQSQLFTLTPTSVKFFKLKLLPSDATGQSMWEVDRGAIHGVVDGTEFSVRVVEDPEAGPEHKKVGQILMATTVFLDKSYLSLEAAPMMDAKPVADGAEIFVWNWKNERMTLNVYCGNIQGLPISTPTTRFVKTISQAHISITLDKSTNKLVIKRLGGFSSDFLYIKGITDNTCPEDTGKPSHSRLPDVLRAIHFFRYHLNIQHNIFLHPGFPLQPVINNSTGLPDVSNTPIEMHLYRLIRKPTFFGPLVPQGSPDSPKDIFDKNRVATLSSKDMAAEDSLYGMEITNGSPQDLYVYLYYFDPVSYCIQSWYDSPKESDPLKKGEKLTVGYGAHGGDPFQFSLAPNEKESTGFIKLYLSTRFIDMSFLAQETPFSDLPERVIVSRPRMKMFDMFVSMVARIDVVDRDD